LYILSIEDVNGDLRVVSGSIDREVVDGIRKRLQPRKYNIANIDYHARIPEYELDLGFQYVRADASVSDKG
jgi:hypothetical protein